MGRNPMRAAITCCAAAALAVAMGTSYAAPSAQHTATDRAAHSRQTQDPVLIDCASQPRVRPEAFVLACGDGNSRLVSVHWLRWDANAAVGRGTNAVNDCDPYCAAGTFRSYPVTVRLDQPRASEADPGERHYTRVTLTYTDGRPDGFPRTVSYPLSG
ncbi:hypothetical protein [Streptomyces mutabilis]|uniref:Secreted protein n=1 Tax=Streptomyces mutabilis TaxID=67332 RepID=A0A086MT12_9ACTN|nr:hypothetical protein [Streptomyces mutabilis]KFG72030.1 hypothetical protein FM21_31225 [Streptomyces mutabilis]